MIVAELYRYSFIQSNCINRYGSENFRKRPVWILPKMWRDEYLARVKRTVLSYKLYLAKVKRTFYAEPQRKMRVVVRWHRFLRTQNTKAIRILLELKRK